MVFHSWFPYNLINKPFVKYIPILASIMGNEMLPVLLKVKFHEFSLSY
jgi:hypothetical protein